MNVVCYLVYFKILHLTLCLKQHPRFGWLIIKETGTKSQKYLSNIGICMLVFFSDCSYLCCPDMCFSYIFSLQCLFGIDLKFLRELPNTNSTSSLIFGSWSTLPGGYFCYFFFCKIIVKSL